MTHESWTEFAISCGPPLRLVFLFPEKVFPTPIRCIDHHTNHIPKFERSFASNCKIVDTHEIDPRTARSIATRFSPSRDKVFNKSRSLRKCDRVRELRDPFANHEHKSQDRSVPLITSRIGMMVTVNTDSNLLLIPDPSMLMES